MSFRLPISDIQNTQAKLDDTVTVDERVNPLAYVQGKRFVVIEDDVLVAEALTQLLEGLGGDVLSFYSAEEALIHPDIEHADCYIVDYMLGGELNGIQFLNQLHQQMDGPLAAVLMTGDTSPSFIREASGSEHPVLHKPVNLTKLISSLESQSVEHRKILAARNSQEK